VIPAGALSNVFESSKHCFFVARAASSPRVSLRLVPPNFFFKDQAFMPDMPRRISRYFAGAGDILSCRKRLGVSRVNQGPRVLNQF